MCIPVRVLAAGSSVLLISAMEGGRKKQAVLNFSYYLGHKNTVWSSAVDGIGEW